jgi:hypothetical protein
MHEELGKIAGQRPWYGNEGPSSKRDLLQEAPATFTLPLLP